MIRAFIFDLGGVLLENPTKKMFDYFQTRLQVDEEIFLKAFLKNKNKWQKGQISEDEFWKKMSKDLSVFPPAEKSLWLKGFLKAYQKKEEMFKLIKSIKENNYTIILLSNTEAPVAKFITEQKYENFDLFIYSCDVGLVKPDVEIYSYLLNKIKLKPEETLLIDDREENIVSAQKFGMNGIIFSNLDQLIGELTKLNIFKANPVQV